MGFSTKAPWMDISHFIAPAESTDARIARIDASFSEAVADQSTQMSQTHRIMCDAYGMEDNETGNAECLRLMDLLDFEVDTIEYN